MKVVVLLTICAVSSLSAQNIAGPCDLNKDGTVDALDVSVAVNSILASTTCGTLATGICTITAVQRVVNAVSGVCVNNAGNQHRIIVNWVASTTPSVVSYNVYRFTTANPTPVKINTAPVIGTTFTDPTVVAGNTYTYVATAVDNSGNESPQSSSITASVPNP